MPGASDDVERQYALNATPPPTVTGLDTRLGRENQMVVVRRLPACDGRPVLESGGRGAVGAPGGARRSRGVRRAVPAHLAVARRAAASALFRRRDRRRGDAGDLPVRLARGRRSPP